VSVEPQASGPFAGPHRIVFANEKGGTGKSTTAVHVAVALAYQGVRVAAIDLDSRQATLHRYLENRDETARRRQIPLPNATHAVFREDSTEALDALVADFAQDHDFIIFDTPGRDDMLARHVATSADTLVTPLNDSFVDFDLIGQVDAETFRVRRLSFYAELIWETRKKRAMATIRDARKDMDWVVVRNRTQHVEARNQKRIDQALNELAPGGLPHLQRPVRARDLSRTVPQRVDPARQGLSGRTGHQPSGRPAGTAYARLRSQPADRGGQGPSDGPDAGRGVIKLLWLAALVCALVRLLTGRWPWEKKWGNWPGAPAFGHASGMQGKACNLLGVAPDASREQIIEAHRRLIAMVHPDRGGTNEAVHEANAARDLLLARLAETAQR
jgi:chromosome partitioning protein